MYGRELGQSEGVGKHAEHCLFALVFGDRISQLAEDYAATRALCDEVLAIQTDLGDKQLLSHCLGLLGHVARAEEDYVQARMFFEQSLAVRRELGYRFEIAQSLEDFACLAARQEEYYRAARLLGAADALCEQRRLCHDGPTPPLHPAHHERHGEQSFSIRGGG